jgi:putative tryptophan/tyrosine transport system substrate-binding protein
MFNLTRRKFAAVLGGTAAWPLALRAQPATGIPVIGFLSSRAPEEARHLAAAFRSGLQVGGYVEGQNCTIEYRWAEGQYDRLPALADELVRANVAVLVATGGEPSALAAKGATSAIPIVFIVGGDPVKIGLVASLNRPGGNATGVSLLTTAPEAKRLGLLHELVPGAEVVGVLINPDFQEAVAQAREVEGAARVINRRLAIANASTDREIETAFASFAQRGAGALLVCADPFLDTRRGRIVALAAQARLPAIYQFRDYPVSGGLMSYGISLPAGYRQAGMHTAQILKGAKPADLPIEQSIRFEFVINLKTAKALGIDVPDKLLALADEVLE